ncbi:MAG: alpha-glucosidase/alpha-galactosidase [Planctomycetes bacterium]|nr:alpha-glucosidase/alpha-galactosidase [Planctomycetota bacterium]
MKVAFIGAGSVVFAKTLLSDILSFPELRDAEIRLMDIDPQRLDLADRFARRLVETHRLPARIESTTDRRRALDGADICIVMIQVGGLEAYRLDVEIPLAHGIDQCVGDTLGPGGIFRGLRTVPALLAIASDMEEVCPDALLLNYSNPMAINCWALREATAIDVLGLCHGVEHTARFLAERIGAPFEEVTYTAAGINHMAWFLDLRWRGEDAYPLLRARLGPPGAPEPDERIRFEMMKATGFFMTESSGHLSEYLPHFRKRPDLLETFGGPGFAGESLFYYRHCLAGRGPHEDEIRRQIAGDAPIPLGERSVEYGARIIHAIETDRPYRFHANVPNDGAIANLPADACVEVPCYADATGVHPTSVGELPDVCAALALSNISSQRLAVRAALLGDPALAYQALLVDPLTAAVLAPHEIQRLADDLLEAERAYLPQFDR